MSSREEFESAVRDKFQVCMVDFERSGDGYLNPANDYMWWAWKASRESLVVELPPVRPEPESSGDELKAGGETASWNIWVGEKLAKADCRQAIEAAGLKVKP